MSRSGRQVCAVCCFSGRQWLCEAEATRSRTSGPLLCRLIAGLTSLHLKRGQRREDGGTEGKVTMALSMCCRPARNCLHIPDSEGLRARVWLVPVPVVEELNSVYLLPVSRQAHFQYSSLTFLLSRQRVT